MHKECQRCSVAAGNCSTSSARRVSLGASMPDSGKRRLRVLPGILQGVLDDHGGVVGGRERVAAEGVAPGEVHGRKHARAVPDDDAVRVQQRDQRVACAEDCAGQLDDVLCIAASDIASCNLCKHMSMSGTSQAALYSALSTTPAWITY